MEQTSMKNQKFINFLDDMREIDSNGIMESIIEGYNIIYESSENIVDSIKAELGTGEENPLDQENGEIEPEPEMEPESDEVPVDDSI